MVVTQVWHVLSRPQQTHAPAVWVNVSLGNAVAPGSHHIKKMGGKHWFNKYVAWSYVDYKFTLSNS